MVVKDSHSTWHSFRGAGHSGDDHFDGFIDRIQRYYDDLSRLSRIVSRDYDIPKNDVKFTYDGWGNVSKSEQDHVDIVEGGEPAVEYAYEDGSDGTDAKYIRLDYVTYPSGPGSRRIVYHNYLDSPLSRLEHIAADTSGTTQYLYYPEGAFYGANTVKQSYIGPDLRLIYDFTGHAWDRFDRVVDHRWYKGDSTIKDQFTYGYDRNSNRLYKKNELSASHSELYHESAAGTNQEYDDLDRLKGFRRGALAGDKRSMTDGNTTYREAYALVAQGNWKGFKFDDGPGTTWDLDQTRVHNKANEIDVDDNHVNSPGASMTATTGTNWIDPAYDAAGNMIFAPRAGDEGTAAKAQFYVYDGWNRITAVYEDDGDGTFEPASDDSQLVACEYDGLNRRIVKTDKTGQSDVDYDYYYNRNWQVLEIRKDGDTDPLKQYIWDPRYIDAPVVRFRDGNTDGDLGDGEDDTLYYLTDANFNITALADTDGDIVERYEYDAYGKVTVLHGADDADGEVTEWDVDSEGSDWDNEILYCGYRFDGETQSYHVRHRQYHPTLGRWLQRDPAGYLDGANLYRYARSSPRTAVDPTGTVPRKYDGRGQGGRKRRWRLPCCCFDPKLRHDGVCLSLAKPKGRCKGQVVVNLPLIGPVTRKIDIPLSGVIASTALGMNPNVGCYRCAKKCFPLPILVIIPVSYNISETYYGIPVTLKCKMTGGWLIFWTCCKQKEKKPTTQPVACDPYTAEFGKFCTCPLGPGKCPCLGVGRDDC